MPEVRFVLNGTDTTAVYEEGMHFLEVLREHCGVTSPKDGCAPQGYCGCCTILIGGRPALACLRDPTTVRGKEVVTLEGIPERQREVLARAFVKDGAVQCGYCIPGIVARASWLLERGLAADRDQATKALSGHLCRCTGFTRIVDAICTAGEAWEEGVLPEGPPRNADFFGAAFGLGGSKATGDSNGTPDNDNAAPSDSAPGNDDATSRGGDGVGACSNRYRGQDHALGTKPYVADMKVDGMLHGAMVLSDHPRAEVLSIDTSAALVMAGVERVLAAGDVPGERFVGLIRNDWPIFVAKGEITRCVGDVLALVVADTQFRARQAAAAVSVTYAHLKPVTDPIAALEPKAPAIHEGGNLLEVCAFARGDVDAALAQSAHVIEQTFRTQRIEHAYLEPEACLAVPGDDRLKVYSQGQGVHDDQTQIAAVLGLQTEQIDVELVTNGGAFGGKEDLSVQAQTALAAHLLERPVRTVLTREQSIRMHPKRHPITMHYTVGADAQGHLTAVRANMIGDTGAYASVGMKVLERAAGHCCGAYRVPNVQVQAKTVYTNNPPCGAMRGFGANQAAFAIEGILDLLAERVGVDGYDIRERNILQPGDRFATGQLMTASCGVRQTLEAVREVYKSARYAGIACGIKNTGIGNGMDDSGRVRIEVKEGGRLRIVTGYTEMGQGLFTILRQVVCEETGLSPEIMEVLAISDPDVLCGMTTASRATALDSAAAQIAARELREALSEGTLEDLAGRCFRGEYVCDFTTKPGAATDEIRTHLTFGYATQVVVLDESGHLERVVAAHDVGRAMNPLLCAGQIEGSVHMGLGYALSEDLPCTGGHPDSLLLRDLGILKAKETPQIDVILVEVPDEVGGYGSKGVGEIGLVPTAGAVAGALHAFDGVRRFDLPMTDAPAATAVPKSRQVGTAKGPGAPPAG